MATTPVRVLLIAADTRTVLLYQETLATSGEPTFDLLVATSMAAAKQLIPVEAIDAVLLELALPDTRGDQSIEAVLEASHNRLPVIVLDAHAKPCLALKCLKLGVHELLANSEASRNLVACTILVAIERKKLERRYQDEARVLTYVLSHTPNFVFWKDRQSNYLGCNETFAQAAGLESALEIVGKSDYELAWTREESDSYRKCDRQVMDNDLALVDIEETQLQAGGQELIILTSKVPLKNPDGEVIGMIGIYTDITARKRAEHEIAEYARQMEAANADLVSSHHQLIQAEKMASIGQLAAGVAHDINNPVSFVMSNLGTLREYAGILEDLLTRYGALADSLGGEVSGDVHDLLQGIQDKKDEHDLGYILADLKQLLGESLEGAYRIKNIVVSLKSFARPDNEWTSDVDINDGIETTLKVVNHELKYNCTILKEFGELPGVRGNPGQLNQVFMNLLVNAGHAIEHRGEIAIRTWADPDYIRIRIADNGKGIAPEHLNRIFDPFFTTKPVGKGTGLGLSISYGIVQKHGGSIEATSEVGKGTVFLVSLPVVGPTTPQSDVLEAAHAR